MKLTKKQKQFIKDNIKSLSLKEVSKKLEVKRKHIEKYLSDSGISTKYKTPAINSDIKREKEKERKKNKRKNQIKKWSKPYKDFKNFADIKKFWISHLDFFTILIILIIIIYSASINGSFISDDIPGFVNNPTIRSLAKSLKTLNIHKILHALNFKMFGLNPTPLHITSIFLHIISVILAFTAISPLFSKKVSMIATTILALHPVNTETVSWISARGDLIIAIFIFTSIILYNLYKKTAKNKYLIFTNIAVILQVVCTQTPRTLNIIPMLFVLDLFLYEKKLKPKKLLKFIPLIFTAIIFLLYISARVDTRLQNLNSTETTKNFTYTIYRMGYSLFKSSELLLFPKNLSLYQEAETITIFFKIVILTHATLVLAAILYFWNKKRKIAGIILLIYSSFFYVFSPLQVSWFIADRYLYVATLFWGVLVGVLFTTAESKLTSKRREGKKTNIKNLTLILTITLSLVYGVRGYIRNLDWKTRESLWKAVIRTDPNSARAYNNLGDVYGSKNDYEMSIKSFEKALEINPYYADATHNLGNTYLTLNDFDKAQKYFERALKLNPNLYQSMFSLAKIKYQKNNLKETLEYIEKTLKINPNYQPALNAKQAILDEINKN